MNRLHLNHRMLTVTDVDNQVDPTIICKRPIHLVTEKCDPAGEEELASSTQPKVARRAPAERG
ncbi:hypothetical protein A5699_18495 [Mycobacterium sp. E802]|uniref:hypothetical protein n=1 Tax=Mycobacterium sp. E802 TaxID=1834152 RepID=UPI000800DE6A|nr:hypothetical protein [Mycobacterium sp. E802]OBG87861.1 hypothetical protein A5699_18495 [Mycobacterium sp. E802]